jgi:small subunit ribosomal protein S4
MGPKCGVEKRPYAPGQFGQHGRRRRTSDFALQLRQKQALRVSYGLLEGQLGMYVVQAERMPGVAGENLLRLLETRLDNVVYRAGMATSRREARQLVRHRHVTVNDHPVNIPSFRVRASDVVKVRERDKNLTSVVHAIEIGAKVPPRWLTVDFENRVATVADLPRREDIDVQADEQIVMEFYSR